MASGKTKKRIRLLVHPKTIFAGALAGILTGLLFPSWGAKAQELGKLYLSLLQMCVLPILITAIVSSLGKLFAKGEALEHLEKLGTIFACGLVFTALLGISLGSIFRPGEGLKEAAQTTVGKLVTDSESASPQKTAKRIGIIDFLKMLVPTNPFEAITEGRNLPVIFFCILFGVSLGLLRTESSVTTLSVAEALFEASLRMIGWVMYGLPIGLFCLFTAQVSHAGLGIFLALGRLILCIYVGAAFLLTAYVVAISRTTRRSMKETLSALKQPILVALGTSSSFAAIPVSLVALQDRLNIPMNMAKLVVPLGVSLNPQGSVLYFSTAAIFMAQLYDTHLGFQGYMIILFGSILGGMSITGVPAIAALSVLSIVLDPLGLPTDIAIVLLIAIDPFIDPVLTCVNVLGNCAATSLTVNFSPGGSRKE